MAEVVTIRNQKLRDFQEYSQQADELFGDLEGDIVINKNISSSHRRIKKFKRAHNVSIPQNELVLVRLADLANLGVSLNDITAKGMVFNDETNRWEKEEGYLHDVDMTGFESTSFSSSKSIFDENLNLEPRKIEKIMEVDDARVMGKFSDLSIDEFDNDSNITDGTIPLQASQYTNKLSNLNTAKNLITSTPMEIDNYDDDFDVFDSTEFPTNNNNSDSNLLNKTASEFLIKMLKADSTSNAPSDNRVISNSGNNYSTGNHETNSGRKGTMSSVTTAGGMSVSSSSSYTSSSNNYNKVIQRKQFENTSTATKSTTGTLSVTSEGDGDSSDIGWGGRGGGITWDNEEEASVDDNSMARGEESVEGRMGKKAVHRVVLKTIQSMDVENWDEGFEGESALLLPSSSNSVKQNSNDKNSPNNGNNSNEVDTARLLQKDTVTRNKPLLLPVYDKCHPAKIEQNFIPRNVSADDADHSFDIEKSTAVPSSASQLPPSEAVTMVRKPRKTSDKSKHRSNSRGKSKGHKSSKINGSNDDKSGQSSVSNLLAKKHGNIHLITPSDVARIVSSNAHASLPFSLHQSPVAGHLRAISEIHNTSDDHTNLSQSNHGRDDRVTEGGSKNMVITNGMRFDAIHQKWISVDEDGRDVQDDMMNDWDDESIDHDDGNHNKDKDKDTGGENAKGYNHEESATPSSVSGDANDKRISPLIYHETTPIMTRSHSSDGSLVQENSSSRIVLSTDSHDRHDRHERFSVAEDFIVDTQQLRNCQQAHEVFVYTFLGQTEYVRLIHAHGDVIDENKKQELERDKLARRASSSSSTSSSSMGVSTHNTNSMRTHASGINSNTSTEKQMIHHPRTRDRIESKGKSRHWQQVGGGDGPVTIHARVDDIVGANDTTSKAVNRAQSQSLQHHSTARNQRKSLGDTSKTLGARKKQVFQELWTVCQKCKCHISHIINCVYYIVIDIYLRPYFDFTYIYLIICYRRCFGEYLFKIFHINMLKRKGVVYFVI